MEPLLVLLKCKPHLKGTLKNFAPTRTMVIFAEDAIYVLGLNKDLFGSLVSEIGSEFGGDLIGGLVGDKISDRRAGRVGNSAYEKFAADVEQYVANDKKAHRFEYRELEEFVYRKNMRMTMGVGNYVGLKFTDNSFFLDVSDKDIVDPALVILEELAPQAKVKRKRGAMVTRG
jgi:hypothetical protein